MVQQLSLLLRAVDKTRYILSFWGAFYVQFEVKRVVLGVVCASLVVL